MFYLIPNQFNNTTSYCNLTSLIELAHTLNLDTKTLADFIFDSLLYQKNQSFSLTDKDGNLIELEVKIATRKA